MPAPAKGVDPVGEESWIAYRRVEAETIAWSEGLIDRKERGRYVCYGYFTHGDQIVRPMSISRRRRQFEAAADIVFFRWANRNSFG